MNSRVLQNEIVHFLRARDYKIVRELGEGACGKTVLLYDDQIDEHFVCKKYAPMEGLDRQTLFGNFVREIKLLHQVSHKNIVRIFNYYLFPDKLAGYILMEFVDGDSLENYIFDAPEQINELFIQAVEGFSYLEQVGVLHRDIRPGNLLVDRNGRLKIIDLGFGKQILTSQDFTKSVSLNWWCATPIEFGAGRYDFATEVYFVAKLFDELISECEITQFKYDDLLRSMCEPDPAKRISSFVEVEKVVRRNQFGEIGFSSENKKAYRVFADSLFRSITKIESNSDYELDVEKVVEALTNTYRSVMLEEQVPNIATVINCFLTGTYYCRQDQLKTSCLRDFAQLMKSSSIEQNKIILANLHSKFGAVPRYEATPFGEIPF